MIDFTKEQIFGFLKSLGLDEKDFLDDGENFDLFSFVGIAPFFDKNGQRELTPYEILRIPPQFENGKEKPIVFKINRRVKKIGKYKGNNLVFFNKKKNEISRDQLIENLKEEYERALFFGDSIRVEMLLLAINEVSSEVASKLRFSYFAYINHYKKMRRQLMQDVFAHFFAIYMSNKKRNIKKGVIKKNGRYRPYVIDPDYSLNSEFDSTQNNIFGKANIDTKIFDDPSLNADDGMITEVTFQNNSEEISSETKIDDLSDFKLKSSIVEQVVSNEAIRLNTENLEENDENIKAIKIDEKFDKKKENQAFDFDSKMLFQDEEHNLDEVKNEQEDEIDGPIMSIIKKAIHFSPVHPSEINERLEIAEELDENKNADEGNKSKNLIDKNPNENKQENINNVSEKSFYD